MFDDLNHMAHDANYKSFSARLTLQLSLTLRLSRAVYSGRAQLQMSISSLFIIPMLCVRQTTNFSLLIIMDRREMDAQIAKWKAINAKIEMEETERRAIEADAAFLDAQRVEREKAMVRHVLAHQRTRGPDQDALGGA
jgi:hypothetical protein